MTTSTTNELRFPEKSTRVITLRLPPSEYLLLREAAAAAQLSMNCLVRQSAVRGARAALLAARRGNALPATPSSEVPA